MCSCDQSAMTWRHDKDIRIDFPLGGRVFRFDKTREVASDAPCGWLHHREVKRRYFVDDVEHSREEAKALHIAAQRG